MKGRQVLGLKLSLQQRWNNGVEKNERKIWMQGSWDLELPVPRHTAGSMGSTSFLWHRAVAKTEHWVVPKPHSVMFSTHSSQGSSLSFIFPTASQSQDLKALHHNLSSSNLAFRDCPPVVPQGFITPYITVWIPEEFQLTLVTCFTLPNKNHVHTPVLPSPLSIHSVFYRYISTKRWGPKGSATAATTKTMVIIITDHSSPIVRWTSLSVLEMMKICFPEPLHNRAVEKVVIVEEKPWGHTTKLERKIQRKAS